jgi:hypothetical protein
LVLVGSFWFVAGPSQGSTAQVCPEYVEHLARAQGLLANGDQSGALSELRDARAALADCARRAEDVPGAPVLLARRADSALSGAGLEAASAAMAAPTRAGAAIARWRTAAHRSPRRAG